jgi:hypothetical protein
MINILSYGLFVLSNILLIFLVPESYVNSFLKNYSFACGFFSFIVIFIFSKRDVNRINIAVILILTILVLYFINNFFILVIFYSLNLIFADYLFSQKINGQNINFLFRFLLLASLLLILLKDFDFQKILYFRLFIILFLYLFLFRAPYLFNKLLLSNPTKYVFFTHFIYYGSLFSLTYFVSNFFLKVWYLVFQIGFSLILKIFDIKIRNINLDLYRFNFFLYIMIFVVPFFGLFISFSIALLFYYFLCIVLLFYVKNITFKS